MRISAGKPCARRLVGKNCKRNCDGCWEVFGDNWDHVIFAIPSLPGKPQDVVLILQPYHVDLQSLKKSCEKHGLQYEVLPKRESFYNPGNSFLIYVWNPKMWFGLPSAVLKLPEGLEEP
jgi:hypothetical protein